MLKIELSFKTEFNSNNSSPGLTVCSNVLSEKKSISFVAVLVTKKESPDNVSCTDSLKLFCWFILLFWRVI